MKSRNVNSISDKPATSELNDYLKAVFSESTIFTIMFILKNFSSADKPCTTNEITTLYSTLLLEKKLDKRTLTRKLNGLREVFRLATVDAEDNSESDTVNECIYDIQNFEMILRSVFGGRLRFVDSPTNNSIKCFFEPFFEESTLDHIISTIISNQYLSAEERSYFIDVLESTRKLKFSGNNILSDFKKSKDIHINLTDLSNKIPNKKSLDNSDSSFKLLSTINLLYQAIEKGYQINIKYGTYRKGNNQKPVLTSKKADFSTLNPYALLTNEGKLYLLATNEKYENERILHYRVDRIVKAELVPDDITGTYRKRSPIHEGLKLYFKNNEFDTEAYKHEHPLMAIYTESKPRLYKLKCTERGLNVAIDVFGLSNVTISQEDIRDDCTSYTILVKAQKENVVQFCLHRHEIVKALDERIIDELTAKLSESLKAYEALKAKTNELIKQSV